MLTRRMVFSLLATPLVAPRAFAQAESWREKLVRAGESQIGITTIYDPAYVRLAFPGGDVPPERGVCTDVVIRAYRQLGLDLQQVIAADKKRAPQAYPKIWGDKPPDANIDHRRVPNMQVYFRRRDAALPVSAKAQDWQPGDLVTQMLPGNLPHIGICAMERDAQGFPLVIHNIGRGTRKEASLNAFRITGHYRLAPSAGG